MFGQSPELLELLELPELLEPLPAIEPVLGVVVAVVVVVVAEDEPVAAWVIAAPPPAIVPVSASVSSVFLNDPCICRTSFVDYVLSKRVNSRAL